MLRRIRLNLAPDTGTADPPVQSDPGTTDPPEPTATSPLDNLVQDEPKDKATEPGKMPKWASQLSPEAREKYKDVLEALGEGHSLTDTFTEFVESRGKLERSILLPEQGNEEDLKRFMKDMGIPESMEGYNLEAGELGDDILGLFREHSMKAGLSNKQAQHMWGVLKTLATTGSKELAAANQKLADTFDERLKTELDGNEQAATEVKNLATKFLIRFQNEGLLKHLATAGTIYRTDFMRAAAAFEKSLGDTHFVEGSGEGASTAKATEKKGRFAGNYSNEFDDQYGGE